MREFSFQDCTASFDGVRLTVENTAISRSWELRDGALTPVSLRVPASGKELLDAAASEPLLPVEAASAGALADCAFTAREDDDLGFARPHLLCELTLSYAYCALRYRFEIYPGTALVRMRIFLRAGDRLETRPAALLDVLPLSSLHYEWEAVFLRAVTDYSNNLVQTQRGVLYPAETAKLAGTILRLESPLDGGGLYLIREAPGGEEQTRWLGHDFVLQGCVCRAVAAGFAPSDMLGDAFIPLYGSAVGAYDGGELGFYRALRGYHEARHVFREGFDGAIVSNTWGDRSAGTKIYEDFLLRDMRAAHELGITHYQVDAGWDDGTRVPGTRRSRRAVNRKTLPEGFSNLLAYARAHGMQLGLWLEPHSGDGHGYACWREDAESIAGLYREHGATFFKLDGFQLESYAAAWHFEEMLRLALELTDRRIFFNIDITNQPRTGYFCGTQYGNFFLSNRYTDWKNYYTHFTQRSLWELCRYVPSYRIQAECLNTGRNGALYEERLPGDPLAPQKSGQRYAAASVLTGAPLAWFEPCEMDAENAAAFADVFRSVGEAVRQELLRSLVLPAGHAPNGVDFTGFQCLMDGNSGYLLVLKGKNSRESARLRLTPGTAAPGTAFECIAGRGEAVCRSADCAEVRMDGEFAYALFRVRAEKDA